MFAPVVFREQEWSMFFTNNFYSTSLAILLVACSEKGHGWPERRNGIIFPVI